MKSRLTIGEIEQLAQEACIFAKEYGEVIALDAMKYDSTLHKEDLKLLMAYTQRKLLKQEELH
tara:strand:- start:29731 stop:29919 length:189 start_codon:yes stop_codon:yes gene_type:complete